MLCENNENVAAVGAAVGGCVGGNVGGCVGDGVGDAENGQSTPGPLTDTPLTRT
jgi:hypothetical protein